MHYTRDRILIPALIPLAGAATIAAVALNFSRVLLVAGKNPAVVVGMGSAAGVLIGATYLSRRSRAMTAGVTLAVFGLGMALSVSGMVALGIEEEREESHAASAPVFEGPTLTVTAFDIGFREKELSVAAGETQVRYVDEGSLHTLLIEGVPGFKLEVGKKGDSDQKIVELKPGVLTYFCDIPGHRGAGMEGTLTVQ